MTFNPEDIFKGVQGKIPYRPRFVIRYPHEHINEEFKALRDDRAPGFEQLKAALEHDLKLLKERFPDFKTRIYFDEPNKAVIVGYAYDELTALLKRLGRGNTEALPLIGRKKSPFNTSASMMFNDAEIDPNLKVNGAAFRVKDADGEKHIVEDLLAPEFRDNMNSILQQAGEKAPLTEQQLSALQEKPAQAMATLIDNEKGPPRLFIGEQHHDKAARKLLIQAMPTLKENGMVLCLEHFFHDRHQRMLDRWISDANPIKPMPIELDAYVRQLDSYENKRGARFMDILRAAKKHGVRVVAIDTEACRAKVSNAGNSGMRIPAMNAISSQIIKHAVGDKGFVALVGSAHACKTSSNENSLPPTPGLDQLCHAQSLLISDSKTQNPDISFKQPDDFFPTENLDANAILRINPDRIKYRGRQ